MKHGTGLSAHTSPVVRALLGAEVVAYVAVFIAYVWIALPDAGRLGAWNAAFGVFAIGVPVALNLLHGDRPRDSGIRLDTLACATRGVALATAVMGGGVVATGLVVGGLHWDGWARFGERIGLYLAWGLVQQYLLQAFALRRLRQAGLPVAPAAVLAAGLFAAVHAPNWPLVALTAGAGCVWCVLFIRTPNLLPLGVAHAALAVAVYYAWPMDWHMGLAIGPEYLQRAADVARFGWP
ncbi:MAG: CPBP family intramembrane metalloprotease [Phycisphaerae bacterium]|nr:CPBP family intramembrane metalloprotease [Phycisphaerae bacterium]